MPRQTPGSPSRVLRWSVLAALSLFACGGETRVATERAPVLGSIPDFVLIDQNSKPFGTEQLRGSVWIADFIFTSCPDMCPMLTSAMATIERETAEEPALKDVRFVSISVDPDNDTPAVLAEYAGKYAAAGARRTRRLWSCTRSRARSSRPSSLRPPSGSSAAIGVGDTATAGATCRAGRTST